MMIRCFGKMGDISRSQMIFDQIENPGNIAWNSLIQVHGENGNCKQAVHVFKQMKQKKHIDQISYLNVLKALIQNINDETETQEIEQIFGQMSRNMWTQEILSLMITFYGQFKQDIEQARNMFNQIENPNVISWNCLIQAYTAVKDEQGVLDVLKQMNPQSHVQPDSVTYLNVIKALIESPNEYFKQRFVIFFFSENLQNEPSQFAIHFSVS